MPIIPALKIDVRDEGTSQGRVGAIDFAGAGVSAAVSGDVATVTISGGGGGGAPTSAQYVTLALDGTLSDERVLTGTANQIALTDGGANGNITLSTPQDIHTGASPTFAAGTFTGNLTVDTSTFVVDATNNRVGIGTSAPDFALHSKADTTNVLAWDSYGANSALRFRTGNGTGTAITRKASGESLGNIQFWGAAKDDAASGATFLSSNTTIRVMTRETFTTTARGTQIEFQPTAVGGTSVATALTVAADAVTVPVGVNLALTSGAHLTMGAASQIRGDESVYVFPDFAVRPWASVSFKLGNVTAGGPDVYGNFWGGTEQNRAFVDVFSQIDTSGTPSNYYNSNVDYGARDASGNTGTAFSALSEGNWTNAGGFTLARWALWNYTLGGSGGKTVFFTQSGSSIPELEKQTLIVGGDSPSGNDGFALRVYGFDADDDDAPTNSTLGIGARNYFRTNTTTAREWNVLSGLATLNFGGANTNKTINLLDLDTVNTATTGSTVNLLNLRYGASARLLLNSSAVMALGGTATRASTNGTNAFRCFDGTAPSGTLTNGADIYSQAGLAWITDSVGNAGLITRHGDALALPTAMQ